MKSTLIATAGAAAFMAATAAAAAPAADSGDRWPHWYVGLQGGVGFLQDTSLRGAKTGKASYDTGWTGAASLGYRPAFGSPMLDDLRFEVEEGYHKTRMKHALLNGTPTAIGDNTDVWSTMGNVYFDLHNDSRFTPYVGAGGGMARVGLRKSAALGNTGETDTKFAYQFLAGIAYAPASIPLTEWTLGYRYFVVPTPEFSTATTPLKLNNYKYSDIELGARFEF